MNKKEVLELKRRFKKDAATFTRVCGCYVDGNHNKICKFGNTFLNLEEDEYYKYLEIANKALSGTLGISQSRRKKSVDVSTFLWHSVLPSWKMTICWILFMIS